MLLGVVILGCFQAVSATVYQNVWSTADPLRAGHKTCLCRYVAWKGQTLDRVYSTPLRRQCLQTCEELEDAQLCRVYKRPYQGAWRLSNVQPVLEEDTTTIATPAAEAQDNPALALPAICEFFFPEAVGIVEFELGAEAAEYASEAQAKTINFFWWGTPAERHYGNAFDGPNRIATVLADRGYVIKYYFQHPAWDLFDEHLDESIERISIGAGSAAGLTTPGHILAPTDLRGLGVQVTRVVNSLGHGDYGTRGYAAIKDLLMLCILYAHGGYFFDTNVFPTHETDAAELDAALTLFGRDMGLPRYPRLYEDLSTTRCQFLKENGPGVVVVDKVMRFRGMEYNGGFVPAHHPATKVSIQQYVLQAAQRGLDTGVAASDPVTHDMWVRNRHQDDVGDMIKYAVCTGLLTHAGEGHVATDALTMYAPQGNTAEEHPRHYIEFRDLKLVKFYGNTWRAMEQQQLLEELESIVAALQPQHHHH